MLVTTSNRYCKIYSSDIGFIPLWLPSETVTKVDDRWVSRRQVERKFTAVYHVKLPDALQLRESLEGALDIPCAFYPWGDYISASDQIPFSGTAGREYTYIGTGESGGMIGLIRARGYNRRYSWGEYQGDWYAQLLTYQGDIDGYGRTCIREYDPIHVVVPPEDRDILTPTVLKEIIDTQMRQWVPATYFSLVPVAIEETPTAWTDSRIKEYVANVIDRNSRFDEMSLVRSTRYEERVTDVLEDVVVTRDKYKTVKLPRKVIRSKRWRYRNTWYTRSWTKTILEKRRVKYKVILYRQRQYKWVIRDADPTSTFPRSNVSLAKGKQAAYLKALDDIPIASANSLQNIAGAWQILSHFAFDASGVSSVLNRLARTQSPMTATGKKRKIMVELPEVPGYVTGSWLGGRYVYSTSVMDAEETWNYAYDFLLKEIGTRSKGYKCHGKATTENATFRCSFHISEKSWKPVTAFFERCFRLGLEPNAYVLWDFVPYSFVADWFWPIGDALDAYTKGSHYAPEIYNYDSDFGDGNAICYSVSYKQQTEIGPLEYYCRWYERLPSQVDTSLILLGERPASKTKVECWRFVDALALVMGR